MNAPYLFNSRNRLLQALPPEDLAWLSPFVQRVPLKARQTLHHWNLPIEHVYFIEGGLVSVIAKVDTDKAVEVWLVGNEGLIGLPAALGDTDAPSLHRRMVQVSGSALRIKASHLRAVMEQSQSLRDLIMRYTQVVLFQASQSGACNSCHSIEQRLSRWLLTAHDRLGEPDLPLTHEILARLLCVRRPGITQTINAFETARAIGKARGRIKILDRDALEASTCNCYRMIRAEYARLIRAYNAEHIQEKNPEPVPDKAI